MYLIGAPHPHKIDAQLILERLIANQSRLVCDAEVLQETLHRFASIKRRDAIGPAFALILGIVENVFPVERQDLLRAASIVSSAQHVSARDALHIAIMERYDVKSIFSFDSDYDRWPGIERIWKVE